MQMQAPSAQAFAADANGVLQKIGSNLDILSLASAEHRVIDLQGQHVVPVSNFFLQILQHMHPNVCLTGSQIMCDRQHSLTEMHRSCQSPSMMLAPACFVLPHDSAQTSAVI